MLAYFHRGESHHQLGNFDAAIDDFAALLRLQPDNPSVHYSRGLAYAAKNDDKRANADFDRAKQLGP